MFGSLVYKQLVAQPWKALLQDGRTQSYNKTKNCLTQNLFIELKVYAGFRQTQQLVSSESGKSGGHLPTQRRNDYFQVHLAVQRYTR